VTRLADDGTAIGRPLPPAACFDEGGFCGQPILGAGGGRIVLAAREQADLLALETTDGGRTWITLRGLR
jgi:hypothetical protein